MAMEVVAEALAMGQKDVIGALTWWTIRRGDYDVERLLDAAKAAGLDDYVTSRIKGRSARSAFLKATQTGAVGIPVPTTRDTEGKVITRDATQGGNSGLVRALMYEETKVMAAETSQVVTGKTAALVVFNSDHDDMNVEWAGWASGDHRFGKIVDRMRSDMGRRIGTIDDGRIRTIVIGWLKQRHRITVRGTGGVYFVPAPTSKPGRERLQRELMAMREWLATTNSPFSIVAMTRSGALSIDDFVSDAVNEIEEELQIVAKKFDSWAQSKGMNSGSLQFSSKSQIARLDKLNAKVEALRESLGERIGIVDTMLQMLIKKAARLYESSSTDVAAAKERRQAEKAQKAAARQQKAAKGKKAGTAKARSKKQTI